MSRSVAAGMNGVRVRVAVDIGGTFTDGVAQVGEYGRIITAKELTTPEDPSIAVASIVSTLLDQVRRMTPEATAPLELQDVVHGTTLVTNAILERNGARTGLIVTSGTADTLLIAREIRYDLYDIDIELPEPLVDRRNVFELSARLDARGREIRPLLVAELEKLAASVRAADIESLGICLLHSHVDGRHEESVAAWFAVAMPALPVSVSSRVAAEIREYERMSTVAANAYVQPIAAVYLGRLRASLEAVGAFAPLRIMVSSGGFTSDRAAADVPIVLLESGPAGGVLGALNTAALAAVDDVLTFDMGGTTAKACVATDGLPSVTYQFEAARARRFKKGSGLPVLVPSIDLIEIGAGGGSIATRNVLGLLNVGPKSAGAVPGPACYGRGGIEPTVTDADLLLGYIDPEDFLGGRMRLDPGAASNAIERLADSLGMTRLDLARGICDVVNENMASAARVHVAEKGLDPRTLTMVATGGAGPVHAIEVAHKLGIGRVLCGIAAGVGSCLGFLSAPARADRTWSRTQLMVEVDPAELENMIVQMRSSVEGELSAAGIDPADRHFVLSADMRYVGQGDTVAVEQVLRRSDTALLHAFEHAFAARYARLYGQTVPGGTIQVVAWRLSGRSTQVKHDFRLESDIGAGIPVPIGSRSVYLWDRKCFAEVPIYSRYGLPAGTKLTAPLLLLEPESTIVVGRTATVEILANLTVSIGLNPGDAAG